MSRVRKNAHETFVDLLTKNGEAYARRVKKVLINNKVLNFPPRLKEQLLRMYLCTKNLQAEREVAHFEQSEALRQDFSSVDVRIKSLTNLVNKLSKGKHKQHSDSNLKHKKNFKVKSNRDNSKKDSDGLIKLLKEEEAGEVPEVKEDRGGKLTLTHRDTMCEFCKKLGEIKKDWLQMHPELRKVKPKRDERKSKKSGRHRKVQWGGLELLLQSPQELGEPWTRCRPTGW